MKLLIKIIKVINRHLKSIFRQNIFCLHQINLSFNPTFTNLKLSVLNTSFKNYSWIKIEIKASSHKIIMLNITFTFVLSSLFSKI